MSESTVQEFVIKLIDLVCIMEISNSVLQSSKIQVASSSTVGATTSDGAIVSDHLQRSLSPTEATTTKTLPTDVSLSNVTLAAPTPVIASADEKAAPATQVDIPPTEVSHVDSVAPDPSLTDVKLITTEVTKAKPLQALKETSERQKLLQRRVVSIADYFAPLMKKTEEQENGRDDVSKNQLGSPPPEAKANDDISSENSNFLKSARRKLGRLFKNDPRVPPCKYLDKYKQISEADLKPVINHRVREPKCLGFGSSGLVDLMKLMQDGKETLVAVKSFPYEDSFSRKKKNRINKKIANELRAMDRLQDIPEFPGVIGVCKNQCGYHIVMEFIGDEKHESSLDLNTALWSEYNDGYPRKSKKRDVVWLSVLLDTAKAIKQMHARGVLHCDIAARNVLLYKNEKKELEGRLADLGLACDEDKPRWLSLGKFRTKAATHRLLEKHSWCAPEFGNGTWLRRGGYHSKASDVWAFGQLLNDMSRLMTSSTVDDLRGLIDDCTTVDPKERASGKHIQSELEAIILRIRLNYFGCRESILI